MQATSDFDSSSLFIGLFPDDATKAALAAHRALWQWPPQARLTDPRRLHITLHFLGLGIDTALAGRLIETLRHETVEPFSLQLDQAERWDRNQIAVLRAAPSPAMDLLHARLTEAVQRAGFQLPAAPPWTPHVTLARRAGKAQPPIDAPAVPWPVHGFALVRSWRGAGGRYEVLAACA